MKEEIKKLLTDVWNVPNILTIFRLILIPVFVSVYKFGDYHIALAIFCLASLTDCLDGFIARKCNLITSFGKLMDPLADKLMVCSAIVCMANKSIFPWSAIIIVAVKEILIIAGSAYMLNSGIVVYANLSGKLSTCCFIAAIICGFLHEDFLQMGITPPDVTLLWISVGLTISAFVNYSLAAWKQLKGKSNQ